MAHNIDAVKNLPQNPATDRAPRFEPEGPGSESLMAGYEFSECEIAHNGAGCVSGDVVIAEPNGYRFESPEVTDFVVLTNLVGQESGQDCGFASKSDLTSLKGVGHGFESAVDRNMTINSLSSVNAVLDEANQMCPIYDVNNVGMGEKFVNTIIFANHSNKDLAQGVNTPIFSQWQRQVDFQFGFVPLGCQLMLTVHPL